MAEAVTRLALGLVTGFCFGFLLQKGQVTKFGVIVGQFLLRDFTVLRTMLTAILVGGTGVYVLRAVGLASLHVKPAQLAAVSAGGLVFGVGMVVLGYCPGTGAAAAAEGRRDAVVGVAGMLAGAILFAELFAFFKTNILTWLDLGPVTLPELTGLPAWAIFSLLAVASLALFRLLDRARR